MRSNIERSDRRTLSTSRLEPVTADWQLAESKPLGQGRLVLEAKHLKPKRRQRRSKKNGQKGKQIVLVMPLLLVASSYY